MAIFGMESGHRLTSLTEPMLLKPE